MVDIKDIELRKANIDIGIDHEKYSAELFVHGRKIGELLNDGWCDEIYIEFKSERDMKRFYNILRENKVLDFNGFVWSMLLLKKIYKGVKDPREGFYQLTFLN